METSLKIADKNVHGFTLRVPHHRIRTLINHRRRVLCSFNIVFKCVSMILIPGSSLQRFSCSMLGHKLLNAVRYPYIDNTDSTDRAEPGERCLYISGSIEPMQSKQTTDKDAPSHSFDRVLKPEQIFNSQSTVLDILILLRVFEEVLIWCLVFFNILTPKLMDLRHLVCIFFGSLVKVIHYCGSGTSGISSQLAQIHRFIHSIRYARSLLGSSGCGIWNFGTHI